MKLLLVYKKNPGVVINMLMCLRGHTVYVIGEQMHSPLRYSRRCIYKYEGAKTKDEYIRNINLFCEQKHIEMIVPIDLESGILFSSLQEKLSTPLFPVDEIQKLNTLHNKFDFYEMARKNGVLTPDTHLLTDIAFLEDIPISFPTLIKPLQLDGCRGIELVNSYDEIRTYINSKSKFCALPLLVQHFIEGEDIDVSILANNGRIIAYTVQKWKETGVLEFVESAPAVQLAQTIVRALGFSGVAHFDMRQETGTNKIYALECNPRFWGSIGGSYLAGVNFIELGIRMKNHESKEMAPQEYRKTYYVQVSVFFSVLLRLKWKYLSLATWKNIYDVIRDPLPYLSAFLSSKKD